MLLLVTFYVLFHFHHYDWTSMDSYFTLSHLTDPFPAASGTVWLLRVYYPFINTWMMLLVVSWIYFRLLYYNCTKILLPTVTISHFAVPHPIALTSKNIITQSLQNSNFAPHITGQTKNAATRLSKLNRLTHLMIVEYKLLSSFCTRHHIRTPSLPSELLKSHFRSCYPFQYLWKWRRSWYTLYHDSPFWLPRSLHAPHYVLMFKMNVNYIGHVFKDSLNTLIT